MAVWVEVGTECRDFAGTRFKPFHKGYSPAESHAGTTHRPPSPAKHLNPRPPVGPHLMEGWMKSDLLPRLVTRCDSAAPSGLGERGGAGTKKRRKRRRKKEAARRARAVRQ